MAFARSRLGNISENIAHMTGPREMENPVINPRMPIKTKTLLILMETLSIEGLYTWLNLLPAAILSSPL